MIPHKAYFLQHISDRIYNDSTDILWQRLFYDSETIFTKDLIIKFYPFFVINEKSKLNFSPYDVYNIEPKTLTKMDYNTPIKFSIKSEVVEIIEEDDISITFCNHKKDIYKINKMYNMELKRL